MSVIETEKATDVIVEYFDLICDTDYAFDESEILRRMNANAIDVEPVRHGKWNRISSAKIYECSVCGQNVCTGDIECYRFCHRCGARMDKE